MMSHAIAFQSDPALPLPKTKAVTRLPRTGVEPQAVSYRFVPSTKEAESIAALRARDPDALDRMVHDHSHRIYSAILRLIRDPDATNGLVQETFLQALRSLDTFRGHAKVSTWLYGIAMNVTRSYLRRKTHRRRVLSEREIDWLQPHFPCQGAHAEGYAAWNPELMVELRERLHLVRKAVSLLPERYRIVLMMRDLEELSTAEVAEALSISEGNVRVRLHRARNTIRALLAPHFATH